MKGLELRMKSIKVSRDEPMEIKKKTMQIIDWMSGNYELRLRSPLRIILFFIEFTCWFYLIFFVAFSSEFNQKLDCIQFQPLIKAVKSGDYMVLNSSQYLSGIAGNFSVYAQYENLTLDGIKR